MNNDCNFASRPTLSNLAANLEAHGSPDLAVECRKYEQELTALRRANAELALAIENFLAYKISDHDMIVNEDTLLELRAVHASAQKAGGA
jgi:hypothetical protein